MEEHLASNTLWPEIIKLYGHGSDLFALSAHPDGTLLASTCKAQIVPQAAIWLWDTSTWQPLGKPLEVLVFLCVIITTKMMPLHLLTCWHFPQRFHPSLSVLIASVLLGHAAASFV